MSSTDRQDENLVALARNVRVPAHRAAEWMQGTRPLPGMDADFYFRTQVERGLLTEDRALELRHRHLRLTRQEEAAARGDLICRTCQGAPPPGFTCRTCGTAA